MKSVSRLLLPLLLLTPAAAEPVQPLGQILPKFEKLAEELFAESGVPGMAVAIVYDGKPVFLKGFGSPKAGSGKSVDIDTVFQIASCSKPMTSTAIAVLASQGKLTWDDRIQKVYPGFALSDAWVSQHLTYRDLLSHRSGLPEFAGDILEDLGISQESILMRLRSLPTAYDFRAGYAYTNFGFTTAGVAAAKASGTTYEAMMTETLFGPAGMSSTSAAFEDFQNNPNHASTHRLVDGKAVPTVRQPQAQAPAGGISSNAKDLARYMQLHLERGKLDGETLVSEEALAQTYRVHSLAANNPATFSASGYYGLGWGVAYDQLGRLRLSHSGAFSLGTRSSITMLPQEGIGIAVISNAFPSALPEALSMSFLNMYDGRDVSLEQAREINQKVVATLTGMLEHSYQKPNLKNPSPALPLHRYAGRFDNDFFGTADIAVEGQSLTLKLGRKSFPLEHLDRDVFLAQPDAKTFEDLGPFEVQFATDGSGALTGFRLTELAGGPTWFTKR